MMNNEEAREWLDDEWLDAHDNFQFPKAGT